MCKRERERERGEQTHSQNTNSKKKKCLSSYWIDKSAYFKFFSFADKGVMDTSLVISPSAFLPLALLLLLLLLVLDDDDGSSGDGVRMESSGKAILLVCVGVFSSIETDDDDDGSGDFIEAINDALLSSPLS